VERYARRLAAGHAVIGDAVYGRPEQRAAIEAVAEAAGVPFHGIWLETPVELAVERVEGRKGDASDADAAVVRSQRESIDASLVRWHRIRADQPIEAVAGDVAQVVPFTACRTSRPPSQIILAATNRTMTRPT
jgi:predicted kinase